MTELKSGSPTTASVSTTAPMEALKRDASILALPTTSHSSPTFLSIAHVTSPSRRVGGNTRTLRSRFSNACVDMLGSGIADDIALQPDVSQHRTCYIAIPAGGRQHQNPAFSILQRLR